MFLTLLSCCLGRIAAPCAETLYGPPFFSRFFADAQNDNEREFRMTFLVTIDGAGGEVKDLEHHIGSLHWQPPVILREICSPMMPPGAHITDRRCISPVLPSASASVREVAFFSGIGKWRRSRSRFTWGRDSLPELHTIPVFPSIVFHVKLCLSLISHTGFCR